MGCGLVLQTRDIYPLLGTGFKCVVQIIVKKTTTENTEWGE